MLLFRVSKAISYHSLIPWAQEQNRYKTRLMSFSSSETQGKERWTFTKKMVFQASHRHILIDQQSLISISTITNQRDKITVMQ